MTDIKVVEEKAINMAQLKEAIKVIKKRDEELGFRTAKVSEYLDTVHTIKLKDAEEIYTKIEKLSIPRFKDIHIHKIIDLMPQSMMELKNIIQGYALTVTNENLEKILKILEEYLPKKK
jgi:DNA-directed RNA polymerase subunit F